LRRTASLITALLAGAVLVAGCADSGFNYVKSSSDRTYFKVPDKWTLYDEGDIVDKLGGDLTEEQKESEIDGAWQVAFDAHPKPSLKHFTNRELQFPFGFATVRPLDFDAADNTSLKSMRNYFVDIDTARENDNAEILEYEDLSLEGGFRGIHMVANLTGDEGVTTIDQTVLVDQDTSKVYTLFLRCSSSCYERNHDDIKKVVDSWTVREK
jgi:hypothetical protein